MAPGADDEIRSTDSQWHPWPPAADLVAGIVGPEDSETIAEQLAQVGPSWSPPGNGEDDAIVAAHEFAHDAAIGQSQGMDRKRRDAG